MKLNFFGDQFSSFYCFIAGLFFSASLCFAEQNRTESRKPLIMGSIRPLSLLISDIAKERASVKTLVDSAASPHDFSLTIGQAFALNEADLLVWNGPGLERFLASGVHTQNKISFHRLLRRNENQEKDNAGHNLHPWLSTKNAALMADAIAGFLVETLPQSASEIQERRGKFLAKLESARKRAVSALAVYSEVPFAVYHDGYREFVEEHSLNQALALTRLSHERPSAKRLAVMRKKIKEIGVACLLVESAEANQAARYANILGLDVVVVDLLATDKQLHSFPQYYEAIVAAFVECLAKQRASNST